MLRVPKNKTIRPIIAILFIFKIGRTGRASHHGLAISLVCVDEHKLLKDIEKLLRYKIPEEIIPGYEPNPGLKAASLLIETFKLASWKFVTGLQDELIPLLVNKIKLYNSRLFSAQQNCS